MMLPFVGCAGGTTDTTGQFAHLRLDVISGANDDGTSITLSSLQGKIVVLDFWGTYCAPCVAAIPHWNELVDTHADRDVAFLSITDENRSTVERFIKRRPINGQVTIDPDRAAFEAFGVNSVPTCVLLDRNGALIGKFHVTLLTSDILDGILDGRDVELPTSNGDLVDVPPERAAPEQEPLFEIRIAPRAQEEWMGTTVGDNYLEATGWTVRQAIAFATDTPEKRLDIPAKLGDPAYDFRVRVPEQQAERLRPRFLQAITTTFALSLERRTRETDVYILTMPDGPGPSLKPTVVTKSSSFASSNVGLITGVNQTLDQMADRFEQLLGKPVINETSHAGAFDFELHYDGEDLASMIPAARDKLGLVLQPARRPIETVVVRSRE